MILGRLAKSLLPETTYLTLRRPTTAYLRWRAAKDAVASLNSTDDLILVLQMGKVGSRTLLRTLEASDLRVPVFHMHHLAKAEIHRHRKREIERGAVPLRYDYYVARELLKFIEVRKPFCKIIAGVRDPIAREISSVFQSPGSYGTTILKSPMPVTLLGYNRRVEHIQRQIDPDKASIFLSRHLRKEDTFDYAFGWFDREPKVVFGLDVFSHPFNRDQGWGIVRNARAAMLVLCVEELSSLIPTVLSEFLGTQTPLLEVDSNVRAKRTGAEAYESVTRNLVLDPATCNRIYSSRFVRHFYSPSTIDQWIARWTSKD